MPNLKPLINEKSTLLTQKNNTHLFVVDDVMIELNTVQVTKILEKQGLKPLRVRGIRQPSKRKTKGAKRQIKLVKRPKKFYATLAKGVIIEENLSIAF
jgi:ribosomal protein L23